MATAEGTKDTVGYIGERGESSRRGGAESMSFRREKNQAGGLQIDFSFLSFRTVEGDGIDMVMRKGMAVPLAYESYKKSIHMYVRGRKLKSDGVYTVGPDRKEQRTGRAIANWTRQNIKCQMTKKE